MAPKEVIFEGYREIIPEFSLFQESLRRPLPKHFRVNRLMIEKGSNLRLTVAKGFD